MSFTWWLLIGMVLLRPGWEHEYEGTPPVYPIGCSGVITHFEKLRDGRYNIILRGVERFRILEEDRSRHYRRAIVERLTEIAATDEEGEEQADRKRAPCVQGGRRLAATAPLAKIKTVRPVFCLIRRDWGHPRSPRSIPWEGRACAPAARSSRRPRSG